MPRLVTDPERAAQLWAEVDATEPVEVTVRGKRIVFDPVAVVLHRAEIDAILRGEGQVPGTGRG